MKKKQKMWIAIFIILAILIFIIVKFSSQSNANVESVVCYDTTEQTLPSNDVNNEAETSHQIDDAKLVVTFLDVGQADCILVNCEGKYAMIDCGNVADGKYIVNYLKENNIDELEYLFLTHPHEDHIGGAAYVVNNVKINTCYMPNRVSNTKVFENVVDSLLNNNVKTVEPKVNDTYDLNGGTFKVLSCDTDAKNVNACSIVTHFTYKDTDIIFTGDATSDNEKDILSFYTFEDIEVLKLGHHGSRTSNSMEFLNAVDPEEVIISCGRGNDYGHPTQEALNRVSKLDCNLYRTDLANTIIVKSDGTNISVETVNEIYDGNGDGVVNSEASIGCSIEDAQFIGSSQTKKYHKLDCTYGKKITEDNAVYFDTEESAVSNGYEPCKSCNK